MKARSPWTFVWGGSVALVIVLVIAGRSIETKTVSVPTYFSTPLPTLPPPPPPPTETAAEKKTRAREERQLWLENRKKGMRTRQLLAQVMEQGMLSKGLDMHVEAVGNEYVRLRITYILANRPFAYQEMHDTDFVTTLRTAGFEEVEFRDGYDFSQVWDLNK